MTNDLAGYYAARAAEYEQVYDKPERQQDLARLRRIVTEYFRGCDVLEVACGTAYWTTAIATTATSVTATDIGSEVLDVARAKRWSQGAAINFAVADAFDLAAVPGRFDAGFAAFWWSHVEQARLSAFLEGFHKRLGVNARVMVLDNSYVDGSSTPISRIDADGNTYQQRMLSNGVGHEILKNFPTAEKVRECLANHRTAAVEIIELQYFWYATYRVAAA